MRPRLRSLAYLVLLACVCCAAAPPAAHAQPAALEAERKPLQLALHQSTPPALDPQQLRAQLERELAVVVVLEEPSAPAAATGATLRIDAASLESVHVAFGESARTVDLSRAGPHAVETLALLAANLMRDEASDLLASLRASTPEPPRASPAPALEPVARVEPVAPEPRGEPERSGCEPTRYTHVPFAANFLPRLGTSSFTGTEVEQAIAFNALGGSAAALDGFELGGLFNHESYAACGAQIAGAANLVNGPMSGLQLAAFNLAGGRVDGGQLAFINASSGTLYGFQAAFVNLALRGGEAAQVGFGNLATEDLAGAQLGFANLATGAVDGTQLGFANVAVAGVTGVQTGFVNVAGASLRGAQVGFVNTVASDATGLQLGFVNVTSGQSRGLMLGFANVSEDADAAVGLLNIYTKGRTQLDAWLTDAGLVMIGVEHGGRLLHNILGIGATSRGSRGVFAFAYGVGARVHEARALYVDVDALGYGLVRGDDSRQSTDFGSIVQLRVPIAFRLAPLVSLYVSPALSLSIARNDADNSLRDLGFYGARVTSAGSSVASDIWPGVTLGARFF